MPSPIPIGRTRGAGLLGALVGSLMIATWFAIRSCPWIQCAWLLYLCTCCTVGFSFAFWCAAGGIGYMSLGMMWDALFGGRIGARPG